MNWPVADLPIVRGSVEHDDVDAGARQRGREARSAEAGSNGGQIRGNGGCGSSAAGVLLRSSWTVPVRISNLLSTTAPLRRSLAPPYTVNDARMADSTTAVSRSRRQQGPDFDFMDKLIAAQRKSAG